MQTKEELVKAWYPEARIIDHPYSGNIGYYWLSTKCFTGNSDPEILWEDSYWNLIEKAKILVEFSQTYRSLFES